MAIQHKEIQDPDLHEPKGISTADKNTSYRADGSGSGEFRLDKPTDLSGITSPAPGRKIVIGDAGETFKQVVDSAIGSKTIVNNSIDLAVSKAADTSLNANSDYQVVAGVGAPWQGDSTNDGVGFSTDKLTTTIHGIYRVDFWTSLSKFPSENAIISFKYRRNGTLFGADKVLIKANGAGSVSAFGVTELQAGDYIQLGVASTEAGNLTIESARVTLTLIKAL